MNCFFVKCMQNYAPNYNNNKKNEHKEQSCFSKEGSEGQSSKILRIFSYIATFLVGSGLGFGGCYMFCVKKEEKQIMNRFPR